MMHEFESRHFPPPDQLARERLDLERALVRFAVEKEMIPFASIVPYLESEFLGDSEKLPPDDRVFPKTIPPHYALLNLMDRRFPPLGAGPLSPLVPENLAKDLGPAHGPITYQAHYAGIDDLYERVLETVKREGVEGVEELERIISNRRIESRRRADPGPN